MNFKAQFLLSVRSQVKPDEKVNVTVQFAVSILPSDFTDISLRFMLHESGARKGAALLTGSMPGGRAVKQETDLTGRLRLPRSGTVTLSIAKAMTMYVNWTYGNLVYDCRSSSAPVLGSITVPRESLPAGPDATEPG